MAEQEKVEVPFGENPGETATLLLAAAEELGQQQYVVETRSNGVFVVPKEVADKAGLGQDEKRQAEEDDEKPKRGRRRKTQDDSEDQE